MGYILFEVWRNIRKEIAIFVELDKAKETADILYGFFYRGLDPMCYEVTDLYGALLYIIEPTPVLFLPESRSIVDM